MQTFDESQPPAPSAPRLPDVPCYFDAAGTHRQRPRKETVGLTLCPRLVSSLRAAGVNLSKFVEAAIRAEMKQQNLYPVPGDGEIWGWRDVGGERQYITFKTAKAWGLWDGTPLPEDRPDACAPGGRLSFHGGRLTRTMI